MIPAHIAHTFRALDRFERHEPQQPMPGNPALVERSFPTTGIRTADAGTPPIRFWTVRFERGGHSYYDRLEAPDARIAANVTLLRNVGSVCAEAVRELDRAEYDRFTRRSP